MINCMLLLRPLPGGRGFNKYIIKPQDVVVTHLRHSEFDRKTLKPLE